MNFRGYPLDRPRLPAACGPAGPRQAHAAGTSRAALEARRAAPRGARRRG